jgi:hypothetical protein
MYLKDYINIYKMNYFTYFLNTLSSLFWRKYKKIQQKDIDISIEKYSDDQSSDSETSLELENEFIPFEMKGDADSVLKELEKINRKKNNSQLVNKEETKQNSQEETKQNSQEETKQNSQEETKQNSQEETKQNSQEEKDEEYKTLFDIISESELKNGFDVSSFKYLPETFMGIETKTFGNSINNPFLKLYEGIISDNYDFEDKCQGVRYMQRINYTGGMKYCIDATLSILKDERYPFNKRYYFFSNNDAYIKLDYEIVNDCHKYVYDNFETLNAPLLYKLLSAQFILAHFVPTEYDRIELEEFLLSIAQDVNQTINYRAECADILYNYGVEKKYVESATRIIKELGNLYTENKTSTIYTNIQNVHDSTINKTIMNTLRELIQIVKMDQTKRHSGEILEIIRDKYSYLEQHKLDKIMSSLERIMIDTAKYENMCMSDILVLVWEYICNSDHKEELEYRLLQELEDMDQTCSTGHLSRILNILSGYFSDNIVQITLNDQLRSNIFARYTKLIKLLPEHIQEKINNELILNDSSQKDTIKTFLMDFNIEEILYKEFVNESNMDITDFYETYEKSLNDYFGNLY